MLSYSLLRRTVANALFVACLALLPAHARDRWTPEQAKAWAAQQPYTTGANFLPSNAINQLEMWQAESFDSATIDRELGYADAVGMKTMRVFLGFGFGNDRLGCGRFCSGRGGAWLGVGFLVWIGLR